MPIGLSSRVSWAKSLMRLLGRVVPMIFCGAAVASEAAGCGFLRERFFFIAAPYRNERKPEPFYGGLADYSL